VLLVILRGGSEAFGDKIDIPSGRPHAKRRLLLEATVSRRQPRPVALSDYPSFGIIIQGPCLTDDYASSFPAAWIR
jgi:hypothetical protein